MTNCCLYVLDKREGQKNYCSNMFFIFCNTPRRSLRTHCFPGCAGTVGRMAIDVKCDLKRGAVILLKMSGERRRGIVILTIEKNCWRENFCEGSIFVATTEKYYFSKKSYWLRRTFLLIVWVRGMIRPKTGVTIYHSQLGLQYKGLAIKVLVVCYGSDLDFWSC